MSILGHSFHKYIHCVEYVTYVICLSSVLVGETHSIEEILNKTCMLKRIQDHDDSLCDHMMFYQMADPYSHCFISYYCSKTIP